MTINLVYKKNGHDYNRSWESLTDVAREYVAQYGWQQTCADAHASCITDVMDELADAAKEKGEFFPGKGTEKYKALVKTDEVLKLAAPKIHEAIEKRIERIMKGEMATRETDPFAVECRKVAVMTIEASAKKNGVSLPDRKSDKWRDLVAKVSGSAATQAEARKRMKQNANVPVIEDLAALLA